MNVDLAVICWASNRVVIAKALWLYGVSFWAYSTDEVVKPL